MKILHVCPYFPPAWAYGGPPRAVLEIALEQKKQGHEVVILTTNAYEAQTTLPVGKTTYHGLTVIRVKNLSNFLMWRYHFSTPLGVKKSIQDTVFDSVHLHEVRTLLNVCVLIYARSKQFVISPWGTLPFNQSLTLFKFIFDLFFMTMFRKKIKVSFGQTVHEVNELQHWRIGQANILVPLGINQESLLSPLSKYQARRLLKIPLKGFVFLFLGRFSPYKGLSQIVSAFSNVDQKSISLVLVGRDDGYQLQLKNLINKSPFKKNIIVLGPLYDKKRLLAYASADSFIFAPTVYEETSTACLEALAMSVPVITTREAEIPFLNRADGVICCDNNEKDIVKAIKVMLTGKIKVNRKKLLRYFSWKEIASTYIQHYFSIT